LIESGRLAPKHTDISNGVRASTWKQSRRAAFLVTEYHLPKHFLALVYMVTTFNAKSWSMRDRLVTSIPAMDRLSFLFESWILQFCGLPLRDRSSLQKTPNFRPCGRLLARQILIPTSSLDESGIAFIYFSYHFHSCSLLFRGVF
jgi:hypothetical protein